MSFNLSEPSTPFSAFSGKRKSPEDSSGTVNKAKKKRQSQSCDACRARKVKCDRLPPSKAGEADSPGTQHRDICSHCETLKLQCTFDYEPKKRGPPNQYLRKLKEQQAARSTSASASEPPMPAFDMSTPESSMSYDQGRQGNSLASLLAAAEGQADWLEGLGPGSPASQAGPSGMYHLNGQTAFSPHTMSPGTMPPPPPPLTSPSLLGGSIAPASSIAGFFHSDQPRYQPPASVTSVSTRSSNPFDEVLSRPLLLTIIGLYFEFINALTPCLHKPTVMRDLQARREESEHPERAEWISLIMTTVALTLVQMPRAFVPLPRKEVRDLARTCHLRSREYTRQDDRPPTVNLCIIRYFDSAYLYLSKASPGTYHSAFAETFGIARCLRLHDEATFENPNLSPIEREHGRRVFFLLFGADKTESSSHSSPMWLREEDCANLRLPEELDDDYISETRYMVQPPGTVSIITGFNYITRLFILASRVSSKSRVDRQRPPRGIHLQESLADADQILEQTMNLMKDCPKVLRLKSGLDSRHQSPQGDWGALASSDIRELFFDPQANRASAKNVWLVQQANIYVTQQLIRLMALRYRDELRTLQRQQLSEGMDQEARKRLAEIDARRWADDRDSVACSLLDILHTIPIESIAINGLSIVYKVRFVASTLLDTVSLPSTSQEGFEPPPNVSRAQGYLWDFLSILSEIEKAYSLED